METIDLLGKQPNERGPRTISVDGAAKMCFVCHQPIDRSQQYYSVQCGLYQRRRHITCARKTPGIKGSFDIPKKQEIPMAVGRVIRSSKSF